MFTLRFSGQTRQALTRMIGKITTMRAALSDRSPALERIKQRQILRWAVNFEEEGGIYEEWPGLADYYVDRDGELKLAWTGRDRVKMNLDPSTPILVRSGGTFASFTQQNKDGEVSETAIDWTFRNTGGGVRGGAYPVSHHTGYDTALNTTVPARVLWDLDEEDAEAAEAITDDYVEAIIRRYF